METLLEEKIGDNQLEALLNYRNSRLFGKNIKNMSAAKVIYNEVLPEQGCSSKKVDITKEQEKKEAEKIVMHGSNVKCFCQGEQEPEKMPLDNSFADFYANYAAKALANANASLKVAPPGCQEMTNAQVIKGMIQQEKKKTEALEPCHQVMPCLTMLEKSPMQNNLNFCQNNDASQQLNRMEQMIREMYLTNQELYKCILNYCKTYLLE